jgi:hypothetical protein
MASSSSDTLWKEVANYMISRFGDEAKPFWRIVPCDAQSGCEICKEIGSGGLIRCAHDHCREEYHVDSCAFYQGGISLEENGSLVFYCETHFKPILFCTCQQKYDERRAMICCDDCCEWYHCTCVGLQAQDADLFEKYTCPSCKMVLREGRTPSVTLKEKIS